LNREVRCFSRFFKGSGDYGIAAGGGTYRLTDTSGGDILYLLFHGGYAMKNTKKTIGITIRVQARN
jgi:hypothetical protein